TRNATGLVRQIGAFDSFVFNFLSMALFGVMFTMVFAMGLYPNANISYSILLALIPAVIVALTYIVLSVAMPRTGGDYVWVGRIIHPALGFVVNFGLTFYLFTFIALDVEIFTQFGLGAYFYDVGVSSNNAAALNLAAQLGQTGSLLVFGISVVLIVVATLLVALGTKTAMRIQKIAWGIVVLAGITYIGLALATKNSTFVSNFNSLSGTNVTAVISSAQSQGFDPTVTLFGTIFGFVYMFLNFTVFNFSTYLSGEVKNVRRSQIIGVIGSLLAFAAIAIVFVQVTEYVFGYNFFHALTYLWDEIFYGINPQAPYPTTLGPGFPVFLIGFLTSNPILIFIITLGVGMTMFFNVVPYIFVSTRNMFAWSFDRSVPESLSRVDGRFHTPYVALIVTAIVSIAMTYVAIFTSIALLFTYLTILVAILFLIVGLSAVLFPYRRKDIFDASPDLVRRKVGGIPVIVILGVLTIVSSLFIGYAVFLPQFSGPFLLNNFLLLVAVLVSPIVIYAASYYYYKSKGIPVALAQKEIPPE
ncbi:MAG: APC family permease, partial [Nitrososphaerales archaeon]